MRICCLLVVVALGACQPAIPEGHFSCTTDAECPSGWSCNGTRCESEPRVGEIGVEACTDGITNDDDMFVDCDDWDCCLPETYELCPSGGTSCRDSCPPEGARHVRMVSGVIDTDTLWTCSELYVLDGSVSVTATLTITPGTIVRATNGSGLVVTRTGRLIARGERDRPIVFTSEAATRVAGDWVGIALFGNAVTHEDASANFGGSDAAHNCGELSYVRVEFAGGDQPVRPAGLLFAACGSATVVDHVQVHRSAGDGFTILGGTTKLRRSMSTLAANAGLGWELGWRGNAQQLAVLAGDSGFGILARNSNVPVEPAPQPRSYPFLYNVTLHGPGAMLGTMSRPGILFENGTHGRIRNSVIGEFHGPCATVNVSLEEYVTRTSDIGVGRSVVHDCGSGGVHYSDPGFAASVWDDNNVHDTPFPPLNPLMPEWTPPTDSSVATAPRFEPLDPDEFDILNFVGAFAPMAGSDWSEGWAAYPVD